MKLAGKAVLVAEHCSGGKPAADCQMPAVHNKKFHEHQLKADKASSSKATPAVTHRLTNHTGRIALLARTTMHT